MELLVCFIFHCLMLTDEIFIFNCYYFFLFLCFVIYISVSVKRKPNVFLKFYRALFSKLANIHLN
jgi:hypothetical protein